MSIEDKATELLTKLETLTEKLAPEVLDVSIEAVRISAIGELLAGYIILTLGLLFGRVMYLAWRKTSSKVYEIVHDNSDACDFYSFASVFSGLAIGVFVAVAVVDCLDLWNYVAIFNPKLALAHQITGL